MIKRGTKVLYSRGCFPAGSFTFSIFGVVEDTVVVRLAEGVEQERYIVVGCLGERVVATRDELVVKRKPREGIPAPEPVRRKKY